MGTQNEKKFHFGNRIFGRERRSKEGQNILNI
jgi:hypothetical protein